MVETQQHDSSLARAESAPSITGETTKIFKDVAAVAGIAVVGYALLIGVLVGLTKVTLQQTGTFGDSFGWLTSLFSGLAFAGVVWTILQQRAELKEQRLEMAEGRRQDLVTRLSTVQQAQLSSYRSQVAALDFLNIQDKSRRIKVHEMVHKNVAFLEALATETTDEGKGARINAFLRHLAEDFESQMIVVRELGRCCKANAYWLTDPRLTTDDALDLHALFLSEVPANLLEYIGHLKALLERFNDLRRDGRPLSTADLFDAMRQLERECAAVARHRDLKISKESLASQRKLRPLFRAR